MIFHGFDKYREQGLLILRIGIGTMFICHGVPKLLGGLETWIKLGGALSAVGVNFAPAFMGFMAAIAESGGGLLLILGLLTRPTCFLLLGTMTVATTMHLKQGDPFMVYSHALEAAILFFALLFIGPGKLSLDEKLFQWRRSKGQSPKGESLKQAPDE